MLINYTTSNLTYSLIVGLITYYIIFFYHKWKLIKFSWKANAFFLPILPVVGTSYLSLFTGIKVNPIALTSWCAKKFSFPASYWFGHSYNYVTTDADEIKIILNHPKCLNKADFYNTFDCFIGGSLLLAPFEIWRPHRKLYVTSFKPYVIKANTPTFYRLSCKLIEDLKLTPTPENIFDYFNKYSFTNFFLSNAGLDDEHMFPDMGRIGEIIAGMQNRIESAMLNPVLSTNLWYKLFPEGKMTQKLYKEYRTYCKCMIESKKKYRKDVEACLASNEPVPLLDLMLNDPNLTEEEIFRELILFATASTDTSGLTLSFCFVLLGMHPDIQENIYKEVVDAVGDSEITYTDLLQLKYTDAVVKETIRLFPPIPMLGRKCLEDVDLGTKIIPKGANCLVTLYHLHRVEKYWPNASKFDPTRFMPENKANIKPYSYLGFSNGTRDCIGKNQGLSLVKMTVANVLRNFTITSNHKSIDEFSMESCITMRATNKMDCHFKPRFEI